MACISPKMVIIQVSLHRQVIIHRLKRMLFHRPSLFILQNKLISEVRIKTALFSQVFQEINEIQASFLIKCHIKIPIQQNQFPFQSWISEVLRPKSAVTALFGLFLKMFTKSQFSIVNQTNNSIIYQYMINSYPKKQYAPKQTEQCRFAKNCTFQTDIFSFDPCPLLLAKFNQEICLLSKGMA